MIRSMTRADSTGLVPPVMNYEISDESNAQQVIELASRIDKVWQENCLAKEQVEQELLQSLRDRKGVYSPSEAREIQDQGGSDIFMKLAATKIRTCSAHITTVLMPEGDMAFSMVPTPEPDLAPWMQDAIIQRSLQGQGVDANGEKVNPVERSKKLERMIKDEMKRMSTEAADNHNMLIMDQLVEGGWNQALMDFIDEFSTFSAAIMEGPVFQNKAVRKWERQPGGEWGVTTTIEPKMVFGTISPFDVYPCSSAETPQDGDLCIRRRFTRGDIYEMKGLDGYNDRAIDDVLIEYGRTGLRNWIWTDNQRAHLENKEYFWMNSNSSEIDGIHYYGRAQGVELIEWGVSPEIITEPLAEYEIDAIKIGRHVIKAVINDDPMFRRPISRACYEQVPGSFWGNSVPFLMRDITRMCNGVARQLQNNMAHSSGLQIEVNYDRLSPETDPFDIYPNKVWQTRSSEFTSNSRSVEFFQPTSNANELLGVYNQFLPQADDATGIPRFAHGNENVGGAGDTARGLALLMDSSARLLRKSIGNIDEVIRAVIEMIYDHNMMYSDDNSIKGDLRIVAKGANALLQRESMREMHKLALDATANPVDLEIIGAEGRADLLRDMFNTMPSVRDGIVPTSEEVRQKMEQQKEQPNPEAMKLQAQQEMKQAELQANQQLEGKKLQLEATINAGKIDQEMQIQRMRLAGDQQIEAQKIQAQAQRDASSDATALQREQIVQSNKMKMLEAELASKAAMAVADRQATQALQGKEAGADDVKNAVVMEAGKLIEQLHNNIDKRFDSMDKVIERTITAVETKQADGTMGQITVNVDASCEKKSGTKKFTMERGNDGKLTGSVVEGQV